MPKIVNYEFTEGMEREFRKFLSDRLLTQSEFQKKYWISHWVIYRALYDRIISLVSLKRFKEIIPWFKNIKDINELN